MESPIPTPSASSPFILASRQKNCNHCVQAKRRCDRRTPVCSRCIEKKTACVYSKRRTANRQEKNDVAAESQPDAPPFDSSGGSLFDSLDFDYQTPATVDAAQQVTTCLEGPPPLLHDDMPMMGNIMDLIGSNQQQASLDDWFTQSREDLFVERPGTPATKEVLLAYQKMDAVCNVMGIMDAQNPDSTTYYVTTRIKRFVNDLAERSATPFLHRRLYSNYAPQSILQCCAICTLYVNRSPSTMTMMAKALYSSVRDLINTETQRIVATPVDKLARTQALLLYQIIRLFDGDITLRAQGEKDIALLNDWVAELCKIRENLGDVAQLACGATKNLPPRDWEKWIFAESLRRTIFITHAISCLYEVLKDSDDGDFGQWLFTHRWTLSRPLWDAKSSFEFQRAWKGESHYVISNFSFDDFLKYGRGQDVDEFAEILLTIYLGRDEAKHFFETKSKST